MTVLTDLWTWVGDQLSLVFRGQCCSWNNVIDLLLVAVFIYYVLVLIRGTRAVQLLLGVLVLVGVYGIAVLLRLELTKLVLQALFAFGIIAVVVVFQPELRRALGRIGQLGPLNRLLAPLPEEQVDHVVDELVRAALLISEAKHGALVVVERSTGLQDYSETGVPVHGTLTAELLASIFMTRSPLHDGAVIVQEDRIPAAACFLPLTVNPKLSKDLGSRHRAAIGLTEENDAVAVVVSEETGRISIVVDGEIERGLDPETLKQRLRALVIQRRRGARKTEVQYT